MFALQHVLYKAIQDNHLCYRLSMFALQPNNPTPTGCRLTRLPLEHVRVATPQQFQSMLEFETCERVDFVVNVRCCKNSVRLTTIVEMLNMLFTSFEVRGCMG